LPEWVLVSHGIWRRGGDGGSIVAVIGTSRCRSDHGDPVFGREIVRKEYRRGRKWYLG